MSALRRTLFSLIAFTLFVPAAFAQQAPPENIAELLSLLERGYAKLQDDDFEGALADFEDAADLDPDFFPAHYGIGDVHFAIGDCDGTIAAYTKALDTEPDQMQAADRAAPLAHVKMGICRIDSEDFEASLADFSAALDFSPDFVWAAVYRAYVYFRLDDPASAMVDLASVLSTGDPALKQDVFVRAATLARDGEPDAALLFYDALIEALPAEDGLYLNRGILHAQLGDTERAAQDYARFLASRMSGAKDIVPLSLEPPLTLLMREEGMFRIVFEAAAGDSVSVSAGPAEDSSVDTLIVLIGPAGEPLVGSDDFGGDEHSQFDGFVLPESGTYVLAVSHAGGGTEGGIEVVISLSPAGPSSDGNTGRQQPVPSPAATPAPDLTIDDLTLHASQAYDAGNYSLAVHYIDQAIALEPEDSRPLILSRAISNLTGGAYEAALADFNVAIASPPDGQAVHLLLEQRGNLYDVLGHYDLALADYARAIEMDPSHAGTFYNRGYAEYVHGDYESAAADWRKALELNAEVLSLISPYLIEAWERAIAAGAIEDGREAYRLLTLIRDTTAGLDSKHGMLSQ